MGRTQDSTQNDENTTRPLWPSHHVGRELSPFPVKNKGRKKHSLASSTPISPMSTNQSVMSCTWCCTSPDVGDIIDIKIFAVTLE